MSDMLTMFKEKVKNQPVAGENPKADPKAKQLCKKPTAAEQLWKRLVAPVTGKPPLPYKASTAESGNNGQGEW